MMFPSVSIPESLRSSSEFQTNATLCVLAVVLLWSLKRLITPLPLSNLPIPTGAHWIWGHEKTVFVDSAGDAFTRWIKNLGPTFRIKAALWHRDVLVVCDPKAITYILQKRVYDYHHSAVVRPRIARLLGRGLGWIEGESEHKRMRHLVSPSLTVDSVRKMNQDITDAAVALQSDLSHHVQLANGKTTINVMDWMGKATLDVIGRVGFGHDFEAGGSSEAEQILGARRTGASMIMRYAGFLALMLLRRFPVLNHLPIKAIQAQSIVKTTIQSGVAREMVRRNKEVLEVEKKNDLLSRLMLARQSNQISESELFEQISTFVTAGNDTTAQTLSFTLWELSRNQAIQDRLRAEIETFSGNPTYDDFQTRMPYLDAVCRETLRLYPGLPYMERVATKADVIPLRHPIERNGKKPVTEIGVRPGQIVIIPIISIHRMDSVWGDGEVFRPERWMNPLPAQDVLSSGWSNLLAFSDGPRNCVGTRLALFGYKVILSNLVRRFNFHDAKCVIDLKVSSNIQPWVVGQSEKGPQLPVVIESI